MPAQTRCELPAVPVCGIARLAFFPTPDILDMPLPKLNFGRPIGDVDVS